MKTEAFYDTECYPNYWLLKIRPNGSQTYSFRIHAGERLSIDHIARIRDAFSLFKTVSFNGNNYDIPMINAALCGYTVEQLKWLNDRIIVEKMKPWDLGLPEWKPQGHIDIMEVAPGAGGLKQYAARIHSKTIRDLPYPPDHHLTDAEKLEVNDYCETDLDDLSDLYYALTPQLKQRERLSEQYGMDLMSKSDAQVAEAVLKKRCEAVTGQRIFKPEINWNLQFRYKAPDYIAYETPQLQRMLELAKESIFAIGASGKVGMPHQLEGLTVAIAGATYKIGIGGLHSRESTIAHISDETYAILDIDVESYYPSLMVNSGEVPPALGRAFIHEFVKLKDERLAAKALQKKLEKTGYEGTIEWEDAQVDNEGGKIMINGTFGKTGSPYSILFAPTMLMQTTLTGQLSLLMLIEWHEAYGIHVVSANTDGIVIKCRRDQLHVTQALVAEWEKRTNLKMESVEYKAIYSRDVNNYFAVKLDGSVKRKGEYNKAGLIEKKNPDVEICSDAIAKFLGEGVPYEHTVKNCRDIRKFITIQKVAGGGVKNWGEGARKGALVRDMVHTLESCGWVKDGRKWRRGEFLTDPTTAYGMCFAPQWPEYLGKVVRWYYSNVSPGPIVYATNGNTVSLSYGSRPCMTLPDEFPPDIDYDWYITKCENILRDIGCVG